MWILFLLLQINFNTHTEYWVRDSSLKEHLESYGSVSIRHQKISFLIDYLVQDNDVRITAIYPLLNAKESNFHLSLGYFQKMALSGMLLNETHEIQYKRLRYLRGISAGISFHGINAEFFSGSPHNTEFNGAYFSDVQDSTDIIRGVQVEAEKGKVSVSTGYIRLNTGSMPASYAFSEIFGVEGALQKRLYSISFNIAARREVDPINYTRSRGTGIYTSFEFMPSSYNILLQFARYDSINLHNYNLPPAPLKTEILPSNGNNDMGGSVTLYIPNGNTNLELGAGSLVAIGEKNFLKPNSQKAFQEIYAKTDIYFSNFGLSITPGYERRLRIEPEYTVLNDLYMDTDVDLVQSLSVELHTKLDRFAEDSLTYFKLFFNPTIYIKDNINLQVFLEYATKKISRYDFENFWPALELSFDISGGNIALFYGKERGGLVCSGGMCRITPRFNGLKLILQKSI